MGIFNSAEDIERKANLKKLEDKRVALAQRLAREGFAPERMIFAQLENGGFAPTDVEAKIAEYQAALDAAGYQDVLAEFQKQFNEWKAAQ